MTTADELAFRWLYASLSHDPWLGWMCALTVLGGGWGAVAVIPLWASGRTRSFAFWLTATLVGNAVVVFLLKAIVRRIRPCFALSDVHARVFAAPSDYSFPSGHAAGSFAFAMFVGVVLLRYARTKGRYTKRSCALAAFVLLLALGVAVSRCALGVHFPSDVLAGAMIGATAGLLGAKQHARG